MKKNLLIALGAVALLLGSCTKDNNEITDPVSPITGLEMPASSAEKPITEGEVVSINGKGFTASDEIWLSTATKAADEVKAEGFALTETGISFTAPAIDGEASLTLKQNGKEYLLGKMFFSTKSTPQEHFYGVFSGWLTPGKESVSYEFREYDPLTNTFKPALTIPDDLEKRFSFIASDNSNIYYLKMIDDSDYGELCRYNVKENTVTSRGKFIDIWEMQLTLTIDNQLYCLIPNDETMVLSLVPITDDGKGIAVRTFQLPFGETSETHVTEATYNPASKSILLVMGHKKGGEDGVIFIETLISLSVETGVVTITEHSTPRDERLHIVMDNKGILLFTVNDSESGTPDNSWKSNVIITRLDPLTLKKQAEVATFTSDCRFESSVYVASNNTILSTGGYRSPGGSTAYNAWSYDLTTKTLKQVNNSDGCVQTLKMLY